MLFGPHRVVVRGGGDLATGVVARLHRAGFPVVVLELEQPLTVRRSVAVSTAVFEGSAVVEDLRAIRLENGSEAWTTARSGVIPVSVATSLTDLQPDVVVDARMAKRNIDTSIDDAGLVVALGPGFTVGVDCHAVIETARGPRLGRVLRSGSAEPNTGIPGSIEGRSADRVLRAPVSGQVDWSRRIGDVVESGETIGTIDDRRIVAPFHGVVRGLLHPTTFVQAGVKIGDLDPRLDTDCSEISDKALAIGGGVLEAVLAWISARS
jgi:xanthine dehydrogenase accessory factor